MKQVNQLDDDYIKYRGKCKEFVDEAVNNDNTLKAVRGYYYDPLWGKEQHWWCVRQDGSIFDPTAKQFPSKGFGVYEEYNGFVDCANCGVEIEEEKAQFEGKFAFCSYRCRMKFVGLEEYLPKEE